MARKNQPKKHGKMITSSDWHELEYLVPAPRLDRGASLVVPLLDEWGNEFDELQRAFKNRRPPRQSAGDKQ